MAETLDRLLSLREVEGILGLGRTTLYRMSISGELCPRKIHRRLGYLETEVQLYMKSLPVAGSKPSGTSPARAEPPPEIVVLSGEKAEKKTMEATHEATGNKRGVPGTGAQLYMKSFHVAGVKHSKRHRRGGPPPK
jgi:predicted DNA-binding transcriptional regulator AlpA